LSNHSDPTRHFSFSSMNSKAKLIVLACAVCVLIVLSAHASNRAAGFSPTAFRQQSIFSAAEATNPSEPEALTLTDEQEQYPLGLHLEILEDPSGELTIEQVSSPEFDSQFIPSPVEVPNYGYTDSVYWVRINLDNETSQTHEWLLKVGFANTQYVDLYSPMLEGEGFEVRQTGSMRPLSTRDMPYPKIVFNLNVPTQSQQTYYLRFQNGSSMTIPLTLWTKNAFDSESGRELIFHWLLFGGILALLVYHLFMLFILKEATYLYFVSLLASLFVMLFSYSGYMGVYLFPDWYTFNLFYFPLSMSLLFASILLFSDTFLELKTRLPKFHRVNIAVLAVWGGLTILIPFISFLNLARLVIPWGMVSLAVTSVIGMVAWRKGFQPVRFFMLAWLGMAASFFLVLLVREGLIPSTVISENAYLVGFFLMVVSWSIALADRINLLKAETESANRDLLSSEHRLSQILEGMPLGVVVYGKDQKPTYLNQRTVEILSDPSKGIQPDLAAGRDLAQAVEHFSFQVAGTGEKYPIEDLPIYHALKGTPASVNNIEANFGDRQVPLEIWASPVRDQAGNVDSAIAVFQDITPRKQAEAELADYRKQLESLVENRSAGLNTLNKELRLRLEWLAAINLVSQIVAQSTDFTTIYEKIVEIVNNLFSTHDSFIAELDIQAMQLKILAHSCHSDLHPDLTASFTTLPEGILSGSRMEQGKLFFIAKEQISSMNGPIALHIRDSKVQNIAFVPLQLREQVLGFLGLELSEGDRTMADEETNMIGIFSTDIAQLIESARLFEQTKLLVVQEERDRLARELHDSVTQALFSANLVAEILPELWRRDPDRAMLSLEKLQHLMRGALAEMRTVLLELRPASVIKTPLGELLAQLTEAVTSRSGLQFQLFIENIPLLPELVQLGFYRIAQEALNNVIKHAQARLVSVSLRETQFPPDKNGQVGREVKLVIQDDGVGFYMEAVQPSRFGINIMRERAAAISATFHLEGEPGHGTLVSLIWQNDSKSENKHA